MVSPLKESGGLLVLLVMATVAKERLAARNGAKWFWLRVTPLSSIAVCSGSPVG